MKNVTKSIAAIAVIIGSLVYCGNAAFAISKIDTPGDEKIVLADPESDSTKPDIDLSGPGSFDVSLTPDLDTHCEDEDGVSYFVVENNLSDTGIIPANRWVAIHLEVNGEDLGWAPIGQDFPVFLEMEKDDLLDWDFSAHPGDYELTVSLWLTIRELDSADVDGVSGPDEAAEFVATNDPHFQKTVSVECSSDDPVETTEDTPEEVTEDTPEEVTEDTPEETEVDDPIEGSPLFTG